MTNLPSILEEISSNISGAQVENELTQRAEDPSFYQELAEMIAADGQFSVPAAVLFHRFASMAFYRDNNPIKMVVKELLPSVIQNENPIVMEHVANLSGIVCNDPKTNKGALIQMLADFLGGTIKDGSFLRSPFCILFLTELASSDSMSLLEEPLGEIITIGVNDPPDFIELFAKFVVTLSNNKYISELFSDFLGTAFLELASKLTMDMTEYWEMAQGSTNRKIKEGYPLALETFVAVKNDSRLLMATFEFLTENIDAITINELYQVIKRLPELILTNTIDGEVIDIAFDIFISEVVNKDSIHAEKWLWKIFPIDKLNMHPGEEPIEEDPKGGVLFMSPKQLQNSNRIANLETRKRIVFKFAAGCLLVMRNLLDVLSPNINNLTTKTITFISEEIETLYSNPTTAYETEQFIKELGSMKYALMIDPNVMEGFVSLLLEYVGRSLIEGSSVECHFGLLTGISQLTEDAYDTVLELFVSNGEYFIKSKYSTELSLLLIENAHYISPDFGAALKGWLIRVICKSKKNDAFEIEKRVNAVCSLLVLYSRCRSLEPEINEAFSFIDFMFHMPSEDLVDEEEDFWKETRFNSFLEKLIMHLLDIGVKNPQFFPNLCELMGSFEFLKNERSNKCIRDLAAIFTMFVNCRCNGPEAFAPELESEFPEFIKTVAKNRGIAVMIINYLGEYIGTNDEIVKLFSLVLKGVLRGSTDDVMSACLQCIMRGQTSYRNELIKGLGIIACHMLGVNMLDGLDLVSTLNRFGVGPSVQNFKNYVMEYVNKNPHSSSFMSFTECCISDDEIEGVNVPLIFDGSEDDHMNNYTKRRELFKLMYALIKKNNEYASSFLPEIFKMKEMVTDEILDTLVLYIELIMPGSVDYEAISAIFKRFPTFDRIDCIEQIQLLTRIVQGRPGDEELYNIGGRVIGMIISNGATDFGIYKDNFNVVLELISVIPLENVVAAVDGIAAPERIEFFVNLVTDEEKNQSEKEEALFEFLI